MANERRFNVGEELHPGARIVGRIELVEQRGCIDERDVRLAHADTLAYATSGRAVTVHLQVVRAACLREVGLALDSSGSRTACRVELRLT